MTPSRSDGAPSSRPWVRIVLGVVLGMGLLAGVAFWSLYAWLRDSAPSQTAQAFLRGHPVVQADLGEPIGLDGLLLGIFTERGDEGSATFTLPLSGTAGRGRAEVHLAKREGQWRVRSAFYKGRDGVRRKLEVAEDSTSDSAKPEALATDENALQKKLVHAHQLYKQGQSQEAIEELDALLEESPDHAEALYWRAQIRAKLGQNDTAREDIIRAVELRVDLREAYLLHDYLLARERRWEEIIQAWTQYLERHPDDDVALLERAGTWHHSGNDTRAFEDLERSCELGNAKACALHKRATGR